MSLVVAAIHDDHITMVSDTKITFADPSGAIRESLTRATYFQAMPKIVRVRADVLVGVTGDNPDHVIEAVLQHRQIAVEELLGYLGDIEHAAFVVAALDPLRLWQVADGEVEDRAEVGRARAGDHRAYELFQARSLDPGMREANPCFRLLSSMQFLTTFDPVPSVGGIALKARSTAAGFTFSPGFTRVFPPGMQLESLTMRDGKMLLTFALPDGVDPTTYRVIVVPGATPTPGALALLIPETGKGLVYRQDRPWEPDVIAAASVEQLVDAANRDTGTTLTSPAPPPDFW